MKIILLLSVFTLVNSNSISTAELLLPNDITTVDIVVSGIKDQPWSKDEGACLNQTLTLLNNVRNHTVWAVWIWNSMHHPVGTFYGSEYSLGNYDQCLSAPSKSGDPPIVTQYCLADVRLTSKEYGGDRSILGSTGDYVAKRTAIGRNLNKVIWGTCFPSTCKPGSISKILKALYLANPFTASEPEITMDSCQIAGEKTEYSYGFYAFMSFLATLLAVSILSTFYLEHSETKSEVLHTIADSFSMKRNWTSLIKTSDEEIGMLNFLKACCATLAVAIHTVFFKIMGPLSNGTYLDEILLDTNGPFQNFLKHADLIIDIFLMMSGLLLVKGLVEKKKKPSVALVNRYFRLTGTFAVVIFYMTTVSKHTGDGPMWQKFAGREQKACEDNWWLSLLMLNNYLNGDNICLIVSWYIPCDYQLAIMGTILFLIWQKNWPTGRLFCTITVILAFVTPGIVTYWRKLPGLVIFHDIEKIKEFRKNEVYLDTYIRSHNRAGPYIIGMAMGYIISKYKPNNYRNVISKQCLAIPFALACTIAYKIATKPLSWVTLEYDHLSAALYAVFSRNLFVFSTCITIAAVEYGDVATIRKFTSWHGFTILSRLAYGIYLTHSLILQQYLYSRRNLQQFDVGFSEVLLSFGVLSISIILSTLLWMFVEAPLNNIVNIVINSGSKNRYRYRTKDETEKNRVK